MRDLEVGAESRCRHVFFPLPLVDRFPGGGPWACTCTGDVGEDTGEGEGRWVLRFGVEELGRKEGMRYWGKSMESMVDCNYVVRISSMGGVWLGKMARVVEQ